MVKFGLVISLLVLNFISPKYAAKNSPIQPPRVKNASWTAVNNAPYSFEIDYDNDQFLLDGKPFRYVSGSFHYFRAPHQKWREILRKMRQGGLNAVSTYVEWSLHEPEEGQWNWENDADIVKFVKIAQEEDLLVILRPGPYICAERDFGGFPYWLLKRVPDIKIRTKDERYIFYAKKFINEILTKTKPLLRGNGGPIIMVQVENEYGSFHACDNYYKNEMRNLFDHHVGKNAVLFTTDGAARTMLKCGSIPGVYATVDFGSSSDVFYSFKVMREYSPKGPLVNSEYYPGWLSHWNEPFQRVNSQNVAKTLDRMLSLNASINFYMYFGGTNFAYSAGANINGESYQPDLTSYDYDAPLDEAGDPTSKYFELRDVIKKHLPLPNLKSPTPSPKGEYGSINMSPMLALFSNEGRNTFGIKQKNSFVEPPTFESLGLSHYLVLYEADLPRIENPDVHFKAVPKDRALVYINDKYENSLNRMDKSHNFWLVNRTEPAKTVKILVENMARVNYGNVDTEDFKGIWNVTYGGLKVSPWKVTGFKFTSVTDADFKHKNPNQETGKLTKGPQLLSGNFELNEEPLDTYLNTAGWGKGVAFMNGRNLGRYWPTVGPQVTLYVPAAYLKKGSNNLVILELEQVPESRNMYFQEKAILDYSPSDSRMLRFSS